jgi:hypothetical protein
MTVSMKMSDFLAVTPRVLTDLSMSQRKDMHPFSGRKWQRVKTIYPED